MKLPTRIFVNYVKGEELETVGVFRTLRNNGESNAEYIHRDVVEEVIAGILWQHRKGFEYIDTFQAKAKEILEETINDAEPKGVAK